MNKGRAESVETAVVGKRKQQLVRPLRVLVPLIKDDLEHATQAGMPYYRAAGEKLLEARLSFSGADIATGKFNRWVTRNFAVGRDQARRYMRYAETMEGARAGAPPPHTSLRGFLRSENPKVGTGKTSWHEPVKEVVSRVDIEALNIRRDEIKQREEREIQRKLAVQLIDIGYKVLAQKLHPDKGGSREAMARLNVVRRRLKDCA